MLTEVKLTASLISAVVFNKGFRSEHSSKLLDQEYLNFLVGTTDTIFG